MRERNREREGEREKKWEGDNEKEQKKERKSKPTPGESGLVSRGTPRVPAPLPLSPFYGGAPRDSAGSGATEEGLTSRGGRHLRLPLRFGLRPQGPCRVGSTASEAT